MNVYVYLWYTYTLETLKGGVMARIQLVLPDEDRDRFSHEAHVEGISLSEWLRLAAKERMQRSVDRQRFGDADEVATFFKWCDTNQSGGTEPDWAEHLDTINASRRQGMSET